MATVLSLRGVGAFEQARANNRPCRHGSVVVQRRHTDVDRPVVLGLIVSKAVGNAVVRNRIRRRLKVIIRELAPQLRGDLVVIRALPTIVEHPFVSVRKSLHACLIP